MVRSITHKTFLLGLCLVFSDKLQAMEQEIVPLQQESQQEISFTFSPYQLQAWSIQEQEADRLQRALHSLGQQSHEMIEFATMRPYNKEGYSLVHYAIHARNQPATLSLLTFLEQHSLLPSLFTGNPSVFSVGARMYIPLPQEDPQRQKSLKIFQSLLYYFSKSGLSLNPLGMEQEIVPIKQESQQEISFTFSPYQLQAWSIQEQEADRLQRALHSLGQQSHEMIEFATMRPYNKEGYSLVHYAIHARNQPATLSLLTFLEQHSLLPSLFTGNPSVLSVGARMYIPLPQEDPQRQKSLKIFQSLHDYFSKSGLTLTAFGHVLDLAHLTFQTDDEHKVLYTPQVKSNIRRLIENTPGHGRHFFETYFKDTVKLAKENNDEEFVHYLQEQKEIYKENKRKQS